ncbi:MAG: DUF4384 domain-containing protein [Deltaproteobacteria bacterium]|nr:DUF4384 domain-containing protein [Deltaproteobacteria bacterium]
MPSILKLELDRKALEKVAAGIYMAFILAGCAMQQISGPTGVLEGERVGGGPLVDCRGYFSQAGQEIKASINAPQGPGLGLGFGSTPLLALDSITGDMISHYQRYCHQYNVGLISREEFLRKTDMLHATQTAIRAVVGTVPQPLPSQAYPVATMPGMGPPMDPNFPSPSLGSAMPGGGMPEATSKSMQMAESIFRMILEAMRLAPGVSSPPQFPPTPGAGGGPQFPPGPRPSYPQPYPQPGRPPMSLPPSPVTSLPPSSGQEASPGLDGLFRSVVDELTQISRVQGGMGRPVRAVLGEISYRNTEYGSPLSLFLKERLREQLTRSGDFVLLETPRLRGIGGISKPKAVTALAESSGADVVISGNYWDNPEGIDLLISMRERSEDTLLGVSRCLLPSSVLPKQPSAPANLEAARLNELLEESIAPPSAVDPAKPLKVEVWTDRGKGAIYTEGEEMYVMVRVSQDAYVRLYYTDANKQTYQIFPNSYRPESRVQGGSVLTIPSPEDRFAFRVKAPFGVESLTALASRKPFKEPEGATLSTGPFQRVSQGMRGIAVVSSSVGEGEAVRDSTVMTTVSLKR